jgi:hypothetical protein
MKERVHCTFANSGLAGFRMGMSASAFSQTLRGLHDGCGLRIFGRPPGARRK